MSDVEVELPGMGQLERVAPPFERQQPKYRVQWRLRVTGYAKFTTWDDPEKFLDDDLHTGGLYDDILVGYDSDVEYDSSWYQTIEVQQEDGTWKQVDADTYERIREHAERAATGVER